MVRVNTIGVNYRVGGLCFVLNILCVFANFRNYNTVIAPRDSVDIILPLFWSGQG